MCVPNFFLMASDCKEVGFSYLGMICIALVLILDKVEWVLFAGSVILQL